MDGVSPKTLVMVLGFLAGMVFGATAQKTHFCTMGGISDMVLMGDSRRFRAWMLAVAVALVGTQILWGLGYIDLGTAIYRTSSFGWLGAIIGGLMFGFGMVQAGGCGNKTLVRLGAGNLKSLVVFLVLAATASMTLHGLFGFGRVRLESATNLALASSQGLDDLLMQATGLPAPALRGVLAVILGGGLAVWCLKDAEFRADRTQLTAGLLIGLLIPVGWFITGTLGRDEFEPVPVASFTFVAPIGDTVQYLATFTGASINFGIATVGGVIAGSFVAAVATGTFRWEAFNGTEDMARNLAGAALMGVGGSLALGCTIGQGLSGVSTLALGSFLALLAICAGGYYGVRYLEEGSHAATLRAIFLNPLTNMLGERPQ